MERFDVPTADPEQRAIPASTTGGCHPIKLTIDVPGERRDTVDPGFFKLMKHRDRPIPGGGKRAGEDREKPEKLWKTHWAVEVSRFRNETVSRLPERRSNRMVTQSELSAVGEIH